jgi:hypothetical protein
LPFAILTLADPLQHARRHLAKERHFVAFDDWH